MNWQTADFYLHQLILTEKTKERLIHLIISSYCGKLAKNYLSHLCHWSLLQEMLRTLLL